MGQRAWLCTQPFLLRRRAAFSRARAFQPTGSTRRALLIFRTALFFSAGSFFAVSSYPAVGCVLSLVAQPGRAGTRAQFGYVGLLRVWVWVWVFQCVCVCHQSFRG